MAASRTTPLCLAAITAALVGSVLGCGGAGAAPPVAKATAAPKAVEAAPVVEEPPVDEVTLPEERTLPADCAEAPTKAQADLCNMPPDFGQRLCMGVYPEVALKLFSKDTPWTRAYLRRSFQAWHVGSRSEPRELRSGEEVIVVGGGEAASGIQVGGRAFDVVRWDGTCVSLMEDELSFHRPPLARPAKISWKRLDPAFQTALEEEKVVVQLRDQQRRVCEQGNKDKCELAHHRLSLGIAQVVRSGKDLPRPPFLP